MATQRAGHELYKEIEVTRALLANLRDIIGDDAEAKADAVEGETDLRGAIAEAVRRIAELEALEIGINAVIDNAKVRKHRWTEQKEHLRTALTVAMELAELRSYETPLGTITLQTIPPGVEITSEADIPSKFWKPQEPKLDKAALKAALKAREIVPGAQLDNGGLTVQIDSDDMPKDKDMNLPMIPIRGALSRSDPQFKRRLALFSKTAGKDLVGAEIDEAIEWCEIYGANPFTRDIYFFVFGKAGSDERRVVPVLSIGLYRKVAARSGNYRPDDKPARFRYDETLKGPDNPKGIVDCEVSVYRHSHGEWHPVTARVRWDERAPIIEDGEGGSRWEDTGEVYPTGHAKAGKKRMRRVAIGEMVRKLDPNKKNWHTMPETMLEKCAEAAAIRKGWPNETAGAYVDGELDAATPLELTATEIIEDAEREERVQRIGPSKALMIDWMDGEPLQRVPVGQFYDQAAAFIAAHMKPGEEEASAVVKWREQNRQSLLEFWALEKDAALALKKKLEEVEATVKAPKK